MSNTPAQQVTLKGLLSGDKVKARFNQILGEKAPAFISSIINSANQTPALAKADPNSVLQAAAVAATLDLPIDQNLGFAYIVPYGGKAQFQMGYKGFVQLALRTGQYEKINALAIDKAWFVSFNPMTEDLELDFTQKKSGEIVGYAAYFKIINGFEKTVYWTCEEVEAHGRKYSKSFGYGTSRWKLDFNAMALKTVLKAALSKWGILSTELQKAKVFDQAVVNDEEMQDVSYEDVPADAIESGEVEAKKEEMKNTNTPTEQMP